jgi:hypothetical protein
MPSALSGVLAWADPGHHGRCRRHRESAIIAAVSNKWRQAELSARSLGLVAATVGALAGAPSFAGAQSTSAWILWEKQVTTKGNTETTTWQPQDGFDLLAECRTWGQQLLQFTFAYMKSNNAKILGPMQLDGRAAVFTLTESGVQQTIDVRYLCFPGTFDPRLRP